ncbi:MAG: EutN/CcmL family microcompartment protein [Deltaproteobacteria bacterium]|nr:EutN/CcmL family microcompartment protein [Deltaproteobacteria bacterium]
MYLARVLGTVVASKKADNLTGHKLMVVEPVDRHHKPAGEIHVAVDVAQAGEGDLVTCVGSREAALALEPSFAPVDAAIIGIVDHADWARG